jgi:hypothetical protein
MTPSQTAVITGRHIKISTDQEYGTSSVQFVSALFPDAAYINLPYMV